MATVTKGPPLPSTASLKGAASAAGSPATPESRFQARWENLYKDAQRRAKELESSSGDLSKGQSRLARELSKLEDLTQKYAQGVRETTGKLSQFKIKPEQQKGIEGLKSLNTFVETVVKTSSTLQGSLGKLSKAKGKGFSEAFENLGKTLEAATKVTQKYGGGPIGGGMRARYKDMQGLIGQAQGFISQTKARTEFAQLFPHRPATQGQKGGGWDEMIRQRSMELGSVPRTSIDRWSAMAYANRSRPRSMTDRISERAVQNRTGRENTSSKMESDKLQAENVARLQAYRRDVDPYIPGSWEDKYRRSTFPEVFGYPGSVTGSIQDVIPVHTEDGRRFVRRSFVRKGLLKSLGREPTEEEITTRFNSVLSKYGVPPVKATRTWNAAPEPPKHIGPRNPSWHGGQYVSGVTGMANPEPYMMWPGVTGMGNPFIGGTVPPEEPEEAAAGPGVMAAVSPYLAIATKLLKGGKKAWQWTNKQAEVVLPEYERILRGARIGGITGGIGPFEKAFGYETKEGRLAMDKSFAAFGYKSTGDIADVVSAYGGPFHRGRALTAASKLSQQPFMGFQGPKEYAAMFGQMTTMGLTPHGNFEQVSDLLAAGVKKGMEHFLPPKATIQNFQRLMQQNQQLGIVNTPQELADMSVMGANSINPAIRSGQVLRGARQTWKQFGTNPLANPMLYNMMLIDIYRKTGTIDPTGEQIQDWAVSRGGKGVLSPAGMSAVTHTRGLRGLTGLSMMFAGGEDPAVTENVYNSTIDRWGYKNSGLGYLAAPNDVTGTNFAYKRGWFKNAPTASPEDMADDLVESSLNLKKAAEDKHLLKFLDGGPLTARQMVATNFGLKMEGGNAVVNLAGNITVNLNELGTSAISKGEDLAGWLSGSKSTRGAFGAGGGPVGGGGVVNPGAFGAGGGIPGTGPGSTGTGAP